MGRLLLGFPLPAGATLVSSSGGRQVGNLVQWSLGTLLAGQSGRQQLVVTINNGVSAGTLLPIDAATIAGTSAVTGAEVARATALARVELAAGLGIGIEMNPDPVRPNEPLMAMLTVTNQTGSTVTGVTLRARMPLDNVNGISQYYLGDGGTCVSAEGSTNCYVSEFITWNIGALAAGQGKTLSIPFTASNGTASGELIRLQATAGADGVSQALAQHTVSIDNDNALALGVAENLDAVAPGQALSYSLTYGNRSSGNITGTVLSVPIPAGTTLLGSSGGTLNGNRVSWTLGTLTAGAGGRKTISLQVDALPANNLMVRLDAAELVGTSVVTGVEHAQSTSLTRIIDGELFKLSASLAPNPIQALQTLTGTLRVTNTSAIDRTGVFVRARVPLNAVNGFSQSVLGGGSCITSEGSTYCYAGEIVTWNVGSLLAGQTRFVTMPMIVANGTASGRLIALEAYATTDAGEVATLAVQ